MELKFSNDTINFLENEIPLNTTSISLYHLPLTPAKQLLEKVNNNNEHDLILFRITENKSTKEIAMKLYRSFAHLSAEKLMKLRNNSGKGWSENADLKRETKKIPIIVKYVKDTKKLHHD